MPTALSGASLEKGGEAILQSEVLKTLPSEKNKKDPHEFSPYRNQLVDKWIEYYSERGKDEFKKGLERGNYYKEVIQTVLEEEELPYILYYLPLIESNFKLHAYSHAHASGPWQFIEGTAKRYGLEVNSYIDERRDPILATEAAVKYLRDLYNVFQSWELSLAAYNCGEVRVLQAIMRGKTRDFWTLAEKNLLPNETIHYVPKFLAAAFMGENPNDFSLEVDASENYPDVITAEVPGGVSLAQIANTIKMNEEELIKINPALKRKITPSWEEKTTIWTFSHLKEKIAQSFESLKKLRRRKKSYPYLDKRTYIVRRGDSLSSIANQYRISIRKLKKYNNLRGSRIFPGQRLALGLTHYKKVKGKSFYFVKKYDTLGRLARRFSVSVSYLKRLNGLISSRLSIGQKLDISRGVTQFKYRVRKGDSLFKIARLYQKSLHYIKKKNALKNNQIIVGQVLHI